MSTTTRDVLERALEIVRERGWTQGAGAQDVDGRTVCVDSPRATSWCVGGAIDRAVFELRSSSDVEGRYRLRQVVEEDLVSWNDAPDRTLDDVIEVLKQAIVNCPPPPEER